MGRVLRWLLATGLVLLGGGLVLGLVLWWLSQREQGEREPVAIEIKIPPEPLTGEAPVLGSAAAPPSAPPQPAQDETPAESGDKGKAPNPTPGQKAGSDDLKRIEGIGPKISRVLQAAGITTFVSLASAEVGEIEQILEAEDPRLRHLADPGTWPEQARLAADGDWERLAAFQAQLKGGRRLGKT